MDRKEARERAYQCVASIVRKALLDGYSAADFQNLSTIDAYYVDLEIQWILDYLILYAHIGAGYE